MAQKILMPALSPTMTEGSLAKWLVAEGDAVQSGDLIAEIETDKATMEVECIDEGQIVKIIVAAGTDNVAINSVLAILKEDGDSDEDVQSLIQSADASIPAAAKPPAAVPATPAPATAGASTALASTAGMSTVLASKTGRVFASPLARRLAADAGIDIATLSGSGPHGRIVKADVEHAKANPAPVSASTAQTTSVRDANNGYLAPYELIAHTNMRKAIAARLSESKQSVPHFYLRVDCLIDDLLALRKDINGRLDDGEKISVNDMVLRAVAVAYKQIPAANTAWSDEGVRQFSALDIAVAVAIDGGLITPIVRDADQKSLRQISNEVKQLASKARAGKLLPEEYQGGSVSVSNLGMYGIESFDAIINPPQACIFAIGAGVQRAHVKDGVVGVATFMNVTMSVDHRVIDGVVGAQALRAFKEAIENPLDLLI